MMAGRLRSGGTDGGRSPWLAGVLIAGLVAGLGVAPRAAADGRDYVWTYEWKTMPQGAHEVEWYVDYTVPDTGATGESRHRHQLEVEYGITDRWDVAVYGVFQDEDDPGDTSYDLRAVKARSRLRLGRDGQFPMNPLLYVEYQRALDGSGEDIGEAKLILDRHIGRWDAALNFVWEGPLDAAGGDEWQILGATGWEVSPRWHVGTEVRTTFAEGATESLAGPTIAFRFSECWWFSAGIGFGLDREANDLEIRSILGFLF